MSLPAGYASRPASWDDLDDVVALCKACDLADVGIEDPIREVIESDWRRHGPNLGRDVLLVHSAGALAAYTEVMAVNPELSVDAFGRVHPDHRGNGLGAALIDWAEGLATELVPGGANSKVYQSAPAPDAAAHRLLDRKGYSAVRVFLHMERELGDAIEEPVVPTGCSIRDYRPNRDADALFDALEEAFAHHWGYEPSRRDLYVGELQRIPPDLIGVATSGEEIVGGVVAKVVEGDGWIDDLGVREPWRGRGVARALLLRSFRALAARGVTRVALDVDAENATGATHLYESVGMRLRRAWDVFEKPFGVGVS